MPAGDEASDAPMYATGGSDPFVNQVYGVPSLAAGSRLLMVPGPGILLVFKGNL